MELAISGWNIIAILTRLVRAQEEMCGEMLVLSGRKTFGFLFFVTVKSHLILG
jgi:hypothetical protein